MSVTSSSLRVSVVFSGPSSAMRRFAESLRSRGLIVIDIGNRVSGAVGPILAAHGLKVGRAYTSIRLKITPVVETRVVCLYCGEEFIPRNNRQRFCTDAHREAQKRKSPDYKKWKKEYQANYVRNVRHPKILLRRPNEKEKASRSKALDRAIKYGISPAGAYKKPVIRRK